MKKFYLLILILTALIPSGVYGTGTVTITVRPTHIDLSSDTAQSAVLVTLSGYSTDLVRYRLYNSTNQYNCWDAASGSFISLNTYSAGPLVPGSAMSGTTFWIVFQRGTNNTTSASFRDRIDPYSANNNTQALPAAAEITSSFILSGNLVGSAGFPLTNKYVVLGYSGTTLVTASSSYLTSGKFSLVCPAGTTIGKIEIRTLNNNIITSSTGNYTSTTAVGNISLVSSADITAPVFNSGFPKVTNIKATQADLQVNMDEAGKAYYIVVPGGATAPTAAEVFAGTNYGSVTKIASGSINMDAGNTVKSVTLTGLTDKTNYDIYVIAQDDEATPNKQAAPVKVSLYTSAPPDVLYSANFETSLAPFTPVSITGDQLWKTDEFSGNKYAYMNGYSGGAQANTDWLISPAIKLDTANQMKFSFKTAKNYDGPDLKVMISSNFNGVYTANGITAATWTDITSSFALSGGTFTWKSSGEYPFTAATGKVYVAFFYESTTSGAAAWEVDDFLVTGYKKTSDVVNLETGRITLYPVPARDVLHICNLTGVSVTEIYDLTGKIHYSGITGGENSITIPLSRYAPGVYLVRLITAEGAVVQKFIIE